MPTTHHPARTRRTVVAASALALAVLPTACGKDAGSTAATATPAASSTSAATASSMAASPVSAAPSTATASTSTAPGASSAPSTAASAAQPSAASTPVPAPGGGNINQTVAPSAVATPSPSAVDATVQPVSGVKVSVVPKATKLVARLPGDVSGPGIAVTVTIRNNTSKSLPVGDTVVSVTRADGSPAPDFTGDPSRPIAGSLAPGRTATGVYAFRLPENQRGKVRIEVRGNPVMGIAVYQGQV